jgi:type II secretory pathway pseudopilin PulG
MELLVVLAITAILMFILFKPLADALGLSRRAQEKIEGQQNVGKAMRRITRELQNAMQVFEPRPLRIYGYAGAWTVVQNEPQPSTSTAEPYLVPNGIIAVRLPKHQYYCIQERHYVTSDDIDPTGGTGLDYDAVAQDICPRHGTPIEFRPVMPLEPDNRIVAYFIGLKNPGLRDGAGNPLYQNIVLFRNTTNNTLNTYALYRVEFNPGDPRYANWTLPSGAPNPDFFYDTNAAANGRTFMQNWLDATVTMMNAETSDVVKWIETGGKYIPHPLCTFGPSPVEGEVAQPNRSVGQTSSSVPLGPPLEYVADHGHWVGLPGDGLLAIPDGLALGSLPGLQQGPRIQILEQPSGGGLTPVFDTALTGASNRNRLVGYDSITGRIALAFNRRDEGNSAALYKEYFQASIGGYYTADLSADNHSYPTDTDPNRMPSTFRSARDRFANTLIVPGSDVVHLASSGPSPGRMEPLRRVGWTGLGSTLDRFVVQADLAPDEYSIDYRTGVITLSDRTDAIPQWDAVTSGSRQLLVKYRFQTNQPNDVVRVSYTTRELLSVNLGIVQFTRARREALPFEVSERIVVGNMKR